MIGRESSAVARDLRSAAARQEVRAALRGWLLARRRTIQIALAVAALVPIAGAESMRAATWKQDQPLGSTSGVTASLRGGDAAVPADTFPHARHERLSCLACHETGAGHGRLTFERPRGCAACHHRAPATARCASCHREEEYGAPRQATVTVTVAGRQPRSRPVEFLHSPHRSRTCVECHTTPVTLAPAPEKAQCRDCHSDHHAAGRSCSSCHGVVEPGAAHETLDVAHQRCDACHTTTTIAQLTPTRSFCGTCHTEKARDHYVQRECSVCHFLADPGAYRSRLVRPSAR